MTSVMKSPNMMSTTGRMPVIAAPRPSPEMPASEMGESRIRSGPNSSTSPDRTLNGVPASATSSPITKTVGSRRSSSASASLTACESVSSRRPGSSATALGEDMTTHVRRLGERRRERELDPGFDLALYGLSNLVELLLRDPLLAEPFGQERDRVALRAPLLLLFLAAVVRAVDVADVVAVEPVCVEHEEGRAFAAARPLDRAARRVVHSTPFLSVDLLRGNAKGFRARKHVPSRHLGVVSVFPVQVVLACVDDRQLPQG